jgi:hypothetical protein
MRRIVIAAVAAMLSMPAQAAEPLMLNCTGTVTSTCRFTGQPMFTDDEHITERIIIDLKARTMEAVGLLLKSRVYETSISFALGDYTEGCTGSLDRFAGKFRMHEAFETLKADWSLQCRPAQRMF